MPIKHIKVIKDKTVGDVINDSMYVSECRHSVYFLLAIFGGGCGLNFYYAKYYKSFIFELAVLFFGFIFGLQLQCQFTFFLSSLTLNHLLSLTSICFIYEDGDGKRFKSFF